MCLGHPKVHFGTIVEGSGRGEGGGVHGRPPGSLTITRGVWVAWMALHY